ncbi:phage antirepressor KilAC domain-containing protein [Massilia soli]|uniref:Phage antirepressor KilAC domain-containing protein n=1 Tax=Massilia soli TaxID=2792854 RepID=A0ABS7SRD8_9BURK|nr:phage antirepressor KilAC domain-containing protein [Massilia soli]MBZ2208501.1 phage antirepressor KilAC domain-containing protein [Massilia soli]
MLNHNVGGGLSIVAGTATQPSIMTSREIAELTGKQHQHVKRDIESMLRDLGEDVSRFGRIYFDSMNREQAEFALDRELTETLLTGYSAPLRRKVVARWRELESVQPVAIPSSFAEALRLAADQQELIAAQAELLVAAAPAVAFVEKYADSTGLKGFRQVAKLLGIKEPTFRDFLEESKIMYRLGGEWVPFSQHLDTGRFAVKAGTADSGHAFNSTKFTAKGIRWVAGEFAKWQLLQREGVAK